MTSTALVAQADLVATWIGAIGGLVGAIGTVAAVSLAFWLAQRERRDRQAAQARLVTITVSYPEYDDPGQYPHLSWIKITNHSELFVLQPQIEKMDALPKVRWALDVRLDHDEYSLPKVLPAKTPHDVPFEHFDADGRSIDPIKSTVQDWDECVDADGRFRGPRTAATSPVKKRVDIDDVTFTFTDAAGLRWRRTGNGEPVRVVQPAPGGRKMSSSEHAG